MKQTFIDFARICFFLLFTMVGWNIPKAWGEEANRWIIDPSGSITWVIDNKLPHADHVEMSGDSISAILRYKVNSDRSFQLERQLVWPMLRTIPNNTHASLIRTFSLDLISQMNVNGRPIKGEVVESLSLNGLMTVRSSSGGLKIERVLFPSTEHSAFFECYKITNVQDKPLAIEIPHISVCYATDSQKGVKGSYQVQAESSGAGQFQLKKDETVNFSLAFTASVQKQTFPPGRAEMEKSLREKLLAEWQNNLILETPDPVLNRAFAFAKIRASESIYKTAGGYMHGPGGGAYYAAIWANDQAEYVGPFFPFMGYWKGNEATLNAYLHFARFMNPQYHPIPSSIIAEGIDIWNGAGDRGDAAMIAYGATRFCLALGDKQTALKLWPLIEWCLEYNRRQLTKDGVVASQSDELEGRFPSGDANLCTSSLYYDALLSAAQLGKELNRPGSLWKGYHLRAVQLKRSIESYFGRKVEGFETYRYYQGNEVLRSWICLPLTVGIFERKEGTIQALFSPRLWTSDGLATQAGDSTFWDRSTLYALRGVLQAGQTEKAIAFLHYYSNRRLLGEHVPYPVEAYPEGGQRHLSAESGLYCRIFTEGLFGIRPAGLNSFALTPQLPEKWNEMKLSRIHTCRKVFDVEVRREGAKIRVTVSSEGKIVSNRLMTNGSSVKIQF